MAYEATSGIQVVNHYGARETGGTVGVESTRKSRNVLSFEFTGQSLAEAWLPPFVLPKEATIMSAYITVDEAFAGLTSLSVGEGNDETTNGITLALADLAIGTRDVTTKLEGEWEVGDATSKAARIGIAVAGTPDPEVGRASLTIDYVYKRRDDTEFAADPASAPQYPAQR